MKQDTGTGSTMPSTEPRRRTVVSQDFQAAILATVSAIPHGRVMSYGAVCRQAGFTGYARHVGRVLGQLPAGSGIPWQRVVRADGHLGFAPDSAAFLRQAGALQEEGIALSGTRVPARYFVS